MPIKNDRNEDLITDLFYLRKDAGFTAGRLRNASTFLDVIDGRDRVFESNKIRFTTAIECLPEKQDADLLLAVFGLLPEYEKLPLLKDRRASYGKKIRRKYDTLVKREEAAIKELTVRLLNAYYAGAPLAVNLPLPRGGLLIESLYVKTIVSNRRFVRHELICTFIPHLDSEVGFNFVSDQRTEIIPIEGIDVETRYVPDGSVHRIVFTKPPRKGRPVKIAYMQRYLEEDDLPTDNQEWACQAFILPALKYTQEVDFEGDRPVIIWAFDKMTHIESPGEPEYNELLRVGEGGTVNKDFFQLHSGLQSGIAWRWE